jgi:hypothetical protein
MSIGEAAGSGPEARGRVRLRRQGGRWRAVRRVGAFGLGLAIVLAMAAGALRMVRLASVPDAPEPFDVAAFLATTVPDDENADVLFREADAMMAGGPANFGSFWPSKPISWAALPPEVKERVEKYRPALEVWRRGTDRPDWISGAIDGQAEFTAIGSQLNWLGFANLEASRLADEGDLAAAWAWHNARLRAMLLTSRRRSFTVRFALSWQFNQIVMRARAWSEDGRTTVPMLRRAIADLEAMDGLHANESDALKIEYLALRKMIEDPDALERVLAPPPGAPPAPGAAPVTRFSPPGALRPLYVRLERFVEAEPDRTLRVLRMGFANWLTQADKRPGDRAKLVSESPLVFDARPEGSPLAPADLARTAATAPLLSRLRDADRRTSRARPRLEQWPKQLATDRRARAGLIIDLASRIYEIETGTYPKDPEALVGKVLPKLPDDYVPPDGGDVVIVPDPKPEKP